MIAINPTICIRPRRTGDVIGLPGGNRSLKRLMIDRKVPAARRGSLPVLESAAGVAAVYGVAVDCRQAAKPGEKAVIIEFNRGEIQL